ncbi:MAG: TonB C-terminal domain-containing protein, partial [candidate division Zixibacteria bacterium]|nr:TonB C-terminal domain-containing protein [candidate division Zixibacteria bacterium]
MRHDFYLSLTIHFIIVAAMLISVPFKPKIRTNIDNIIQVSLASFPQSFQFGRSQLAAVTKTPSATSSAVPLPEVKSKSTNKLKAKEGSKTNLSDKMPKEKTAEGQKDISENLGAGSPFGGAAVDNASFDYPYWFVQAFSKIERNWNNPVYANRPLSCIIYFQVIRSGRFITMEIEQSSTIDAFDRACERAVKLAEPLPP